MTVTYSFHSADIGFAVVSGGGLARYESLNIVDQVHDSVVCSVVCEGKVESEGTTARCGDVMVHPAHRPFSERASQPGLHAWLMFRFETFHPIWSTLHHGCVVRAPAIDTVHSHFDQLKAALDRGSLSVQGAAFLTLLSEFEPSLPASVYGKVPRFQELRQWIVAHPGEDLSRRKLAVRIGMHPNAFDRAFRLETGQSSQEFVRSVRLDRAKRLLAFSSLTLDAIALDVGLATGAYFSRWFKQSSGLSPGQFRESVKKTRTGYLEIQAPE